MKNKTICFFAICICFISCNKKDFWSWNLVGKAKVEDLKIKSNALLKFTLEANFKSIGNDKNAKLGFVISETVLSPEIDNCDTVLYLKDSELGIKSISIDWFTNGNLKCRAFIINEIETIYSDIITVTWIGGNTNLPVVQTLVPNSVSFYNAICGANLISDGGLTVSKLGVLISTQSIPTLSNSQIIKYHSNDVAFTSVLDNLNENTTYSCRGFAENLAGVSLSNNIYQFTTKNFFNVGEQGPAGGVVFYSKIDTLGGWNFLECSPSDLNSMFPWVAFNNSVTINLGTSIGEGKTNTTNIVNAFGLSGLNYAAKMCVTMNLNGFDDWFLPSRDELIIMYQNLYLQNLGSFTNGAKYWTSSEDNFFTQNAWCQKMSNNLGTVNSLTELKTVGLKIRPIRCF